MTVKGAKELWERYKYIGAAALVGIILLVLPTPHPHYFIGTDKVVKNKEIM